MKKRILGIFTFFVGMIGGMAGAGKFMGKKLDTASQYSDKHLSLFLMMNQWVKVKQEGKNLSSYFQRNGYKKIAIYGMSYAGETLLDELRESETQVAYGIDQNSENLYSDIDIFSVEDSLEEVNAVVVTAIKFFDEIEEVLSGKLSCPIISLEEILYEV